MRQLYYVIFVVSVLGLIASGFVHALTFLGINPEGYFPEIWWLHILIFVVWISVILCHRKLHNKEKTESWDALIHYAPVWMKALTVFLFFYVFYNFIFCMFVLNKGGVPSEIDGRKVLHNHGKIIQELTDEEYYAHVAYETRGFSGHWLVFYSMGMTAMYSNIRRKVQQVDGH